MQVHAVDQGYSLLSCYGYTASSNRRCTANAGKLKWGSSVSRKVTMATRSLPDTSWPSGIPQTRALCSVLSSVVPQKMPKSVPLKNYRDYRGNPVIGKVQILPDEAAKQALSFVYSGALQCRLLFHFQNCWSCTCWPCILKIYSWLKLARVFWRILWTKLEPNGIQNLLKSCGVNLRE